MCCSELGLFRSLNPEAKTMKVRKAWALYICHLYKPLLADFDLMNLKQNTSIHGTCAGAEKDPQLRSLESKTERSAEGDLPTEGFTARVRGDVAKGTRVKG